VKRVRWLCAGVALACLAGTGGAVAAPARVGYVLEASGRWVAAGSANAPLSPGHPLHAGDVLKVMDPTARDFIVLANVEGRNTRRIDCKETRVCAEGIAVPRELQQVARARTTILEAVMDRWRGRPPSYAEFVVRGGHLSDGVALLDAGGLEVRPVFEGSRADRYHVRLRPIGSDGTPAASTWTVPVLYDWDPDRATPLMLVGFKPGLYELSAAAGSSPDKYGPAVWVLAIPPNQHQAASTAFSDARAVSRTWGTDVRPEVVHSFLRAHLEQLAAELPR
jgi:hypothetical protein